MAPSYEEYRGLLGYSVSFFKSGCPSYKLDFSAGESLEVVVSAVLAPWSLFSYLWVIEHPCLSLGTQPWMWSRHGQVAHSGLLAEVFGWWWAHDPSWSEQNWCWHFSQNSRKKAFLPSRPGTMLMLALEEWSPPWEFTLLEMKQHRMAETGDGERLLLDNFIWAGEFSLEFWLSGESSVLKFNACSRANDCS